jgi:aspartate aminotransferase-like enzyme
MRTYPIPMVPGPVALPQAVLDAYKINYGSADIESEFIELFNKTETVLKKILQTKNQVVIQSGEGMLALWSALKSCLLPGDRVLSITTGVFGDGIGDMASAIGATVKKVSLPYNETISDMSKIEDALVSFEPKMITVVHCETPSGTLNPIMELGQMKKQYHVPLLYVDAVASAGGAPVFSDEWNIDLCLGGSQKCLSSLPDTSFLAVSNAAWEIINEVNYPGYDALKPFQQAPQRHYFPYTPNWHGIAGLYAGAALILKEGLENSFARHESVARYCREKLIEMGFSLFPSPLAIQSPTVTAVNIPESITWQALDSRLRHHGLVVGGSYGPLAGKVFRLGHMGTQADMALAELAIDVLSRISQELNLT